MSSTYLDKYNTDLYYLGRRLYVNGLSVFEEMLKPFISKQNIKEYGRSAIKLFKVNKFIYNQSYVLVYNSYDIRGNKKLKTASARIDVIIGSAEYTLLLFENSDGYRRYSFFLIMS